MYVLNVCFMQSRFTLGFVGRHTVGVPLYIYVSVCVGGGHIFYVVCTMRVQIGAASRQYLTCHNTSSPCIIL